MDLILYVGVLVNEAEDAEEDSEEPSFRQQFEAVNAELRRSGIPIHHEPSRMEEGDWWVRSSWEELEELMEFAEDRREAETEDFDHLLHISREQIALPVEFTLPISVEENPDILCNELISSLALMRVCGELGRSMGLDPEQFPLLSGDAREPDAEREFSSLLRQLNVPSGMHRAARMCITLYHACEISADSRAAIYFE